MKNFIVTLSLMLAFSPVLAENIYINGDVASRCSIVEDTAGRWGNPSANVLTTLPASGGQVPVIRFDYSLANAFYASSKYKTIRFDSSWNDLVLSNQCCHAWRR